jgi:hypothetical protein
MPKVLLVMFLLAAAGDFRRQEAESQSCFGTLMSSVMCEADFLQRNRIGQQIAQQERRGVGTSVGLALPGKSSNQGKLYNVQRRALHLHSQRMKQ